MFTEIEKAEGEGSKSLHCAVCSVSTEQVILLQTISESYEGLCTLRTLHKSYSHTAENGWRSLIAIFTFDPTTAERYLKSVPQFDLRVEQFTEDLIAYSQ